MPQFLQPDTDPNAITKSVEAEGFIINRRAHGLWYIEGRSDKRLMPVAFKNMRFTSDKIAIQFIQSYK